MIRSVHHPDWENWHDEIMEGIRDCKLFVILISFLTGMFIGWLVVRHVRTLEPGITRAQDWSVSAGWGCRAIVAALIAGLTVLFLASTFGLYTPRGHNLRIFTLREPQFPGTARAPRHRSPGQVAGV